MTHIPVSERRAGIADNLAIAVVLHHDDKNVVEVWNAAGNCAFCGEEPARKQSHQAKHKLAFHEGCHLRDQNRGPAGEQLRPGGAKLSTAPLLEDERWMKI